MSSTAPVLPRFNHSGVFERRTNVRFHAHAGTELILLRKGTCSIEVGSLLLHGTPGTLFILPGNVSHNQINSGRVHTIYATFHHPYFNSAPRTLQVGVNSLVDAWLQQIDDLNRQPGLQNTEVLSGLVYAIVSLIEATEAIDKKRKRYPASLCAALEAIEKNPASSFSLRELAAAAKVSPSYLIALFQRYLGASPIAYATGIRMKTAATQLRNPYLSIKQVALQCGFRDTNYFCRLFRKHFGCSAGEYRKHRRR